MSELLGRTTSRAADDSRPEQVLIGPVWLSRITERGCVDRVIGELQEGRGGWVITPNLDIIRQLQRNPELLRMAGNAELRVADGMPLIWASRLQGTPLPERVCGSNLIFSVSEAAAEAGFSVFFLGGAGRSAERASEILRQRFSNLRVAGTYNPPMGFEREPREMERIAQALLDARPDIVYVGLGFPKQELLIDRMRELLPDAWWLGVGISFSFVCGEVRRAPRWVQRLGLEWVHRLVQEPRRLIRRYLVDDIPFAMSLLGGALVRRFTGAGETVRR